MNTDPTDWAKIWEQMRNIPEQSSMGITIRDDDEWVISKKPEMKRLGECTNSTTEK